MGGLRKLNNRSAGYMYCTGTDNSITIVVVENENSYMGKVSTESESVLKWSRNLDKSLPDYMALFVEAVEGREGRSKEGYDDIFDIQDGYLVWKQFFPNQNVYGKLGKFKLEKVEFKEAVSECLEGATRELEARAAHIRTLKQQHQQMSSKLSQAMEVAAKSVKMKEDFENEVYGKCAAIVNAKKHRILELRSSGGPHPGPSSRPPSEGEWDTSPQKRKVSRQPQKKKKAKVWSSGSSDGYSSDTDIDAGSSSDGGNPPSTPPPFSHPQRATGKGGDNTHKGAALDSQDLFNDSLEVELYPSHPPTKPREGITSPTATTTTTTITTTSATTTKASQPPSHQHTMPTSGREKGSVDVPDDSEISIIDQIF